MSVNISRRSHGYPTYSRNVYKMKKKQLFIYTNFSTFVQADYEILSSKQTVTKFQFKLGTPLRGIISLCQQLIFLILNIRSHHSVYIWFADYHSFLPVFFASVFRKKSFVVIGGYDLADMPELHYGSLSKPLRRTLTLYTLKHATCCLPVVESLEQKLQQVCPGARAKTIYTGYRPLDSKQDLAQVREKIVLTVSITNSRQRLLIKGLDRFMELAEKLPDYNFLIAGVNESARQLFGKIPSNLCLLPPLTRQELIEQYRRAAFYAQFSRSEGLPNALCEAMLYGCIPLGIKTGGIATAVSTLGLIMDSWNCQSAIDFIKTQHNLIDRESIRKHILDNFSLERRARQLLNLR